MTTKMQAGSAAGLEEAAKRRTDLKAGGVAVLALVALIGLTTIARTTSERVLTELPLSAQLVPLRIAPAGTTDATATPAAPSESDLSLQAYAPHGG